jgi:hypothetical protein
VVLAGVNPHLPAAYESVLSVSLTPQWKGRIPVAGRP